MQMQEIRLYETHSHTPLCHHAEGLPGEYAAVAQERGLDGLIVTCHGPLPDGLSAPVRMQPEELDRYFDLVAEARSQWEGVVDVRLGLESDYLPGLERWIEHLHQRADFQYILGSVHPHIPEYKDAYLNGSWAEFHKVYYRHLAEAAETGFYDCLAHPDIVKNLGSEEWDLKALMPDICRALDRIAETGVAMELNTSGLYKRVPEMNPAPGILREMLERDISVVIGADAHVPERVGDRYTEAAHLLETVGYKDVCIFLDRQPVPVPIKELLQKLKPEPSLHG
jgi:histidinol-phosphatase (PHP family)